MTKKDIRELIEINAELFEILEKEFYAETDRVKRMKLFAKLIETDQRIDELEKMKKNWFINNLKVKLSR